MLCASICVGIVDYIDPQYQASDMRLRYAASDAEAFFRYATEVSGDRRDDPKLHNFLANREATADNLKAAFASVGRIKGIELFFLYLSGHGELDETSAGWFCLADAKPREPSLTGQQIGQLLSTIIAKHVVVLIDCCHAEAIATGIGFPPSLGDRTGQIVVASARANQRSWEDNGLRRSIFSDVVLRGLCLGSSIADSTGRVDMETALLPYLREQVPLETAARKRGHVQEPVSGGWTAQPLKLPTVEGRSLGRPLTISETIRAGIRHALIGLTIGVGIALLVIDALIFHLTVTSAGHIIVRPGLSFSFGLMPFHLTPQVDTGLNLSDLDPANSDVFRALADGTIRGIRTHSDQQGLRTWLANMTPALRSEREKSIAALARGEASKFVPDEDRAPIEEAAFLATYRDRPIADLAHEIYPYSYSVTLTCGEPVNSNFDFTILPASSAVFARDMRWLAATAPIDAKARAIRVVIMVRLAAYRAAHPSARDTAFIGGTTLNDPKWIAQAANDAERLFASPTARRSDSDDPFVEFVAFANAIIALREFTLRRDDFAPIISAALRDAKKTWCGRHAAFVLAALGEPNDSIAAEGEFSRILAADTSNSAPQNDFGELIATEALGQLAHIRPLQYSTLETLASIIEQGNDLSSDTPSHTLLNRIAAVQPLSDRLKDILFEALRSSVDKSGLNPLVAVRVLARNMKYLAKEQQTEVADWLISHAEENRTMSDVHEALGQISLVRSLNPGQLNILETQLPLASLFVLPDSNYRGEIVIRVGGEAAAIALGRVGQTLSLSDVTLQRLTNLAMAQKKLIGREELLKGLAANWYGAADNIAATAFDRLVEAEGSEDRRSLEIEVAGVRLQSMTLDKRRQALKTLIGRWDEETEPELRMSLARLVAVASLPQRISASGGAD